ncbi:alpha/beta hydrolase [Pseudonocardiaceae bacterium YIM PH 21723]|nr:alpha/beta hydrolase [Pseudonocardiaceae bacterium YIM PH 21723]
MNPEVTVDVLGEPYTARVIELGISHGERTVATLVRLMAATHSPRGAVLYVHGWSDYFFQTHVAERFAELGFDFYGLDLRRYGRSLLPGQLPAYCTDVAEYFEDIDAAIELIKADGHRRLAVMGHSTGGLVTPLWANARRGHDMLGALILNSPWLELAKPWVFRTAGTRLLDPLGRLRPTQVIPAGVGDLYGKSISSTAHGEWDFDLTWKPIPGFPVYAGWFRAIRRAHAQVHRGLDVDVPTLLMHSDKSLFTAHFSEAALRADTVLNVRDMITYGARLGLKVHQVEIADGMHDLFLSAKPVRDKALRTATDWLDTRL